MRFFRDFLIIIMTVMLVGAVAVCAFADEANDAAFAIAENGILPEAVSDGAKEVTERAGSVQNRIYLSHFGGYSGSDALKGELYGQTFLIFPKKHPDIIDELLRAIKNAYACVIEENPVGEYTIIHTAKWEDKTSWKKDWLTDDYGTLLENRFILASYIMNNKDDYPQVYSFDIQNFNAVAFGFDQDRFWGGTGFEGAFAGKKVYFYNVDMIGGKLATSGKWGTPEFHSDSYVTVGEPDGSAISVNPSVTVDSAMSLETKLDSKKSAENQYTVERIYSMSSTYKLLVIVVIIGSVGAIIYIIIKKRGKTRSHRHRHKHHHHHHHSSHSEDTSGEHSHSESSRGEVDTTMFSGNPKKD